MGRDADGNIVDQGEVVTHRSPGSSLHNFGLAVDSCFTGKDPYWEYLAHRDPAEALRRWNEFGRICKSYGLVWGGDFTTIKDKPHAELSYGMDLKKIQEIYKFGGLEGVHKRIDQIRNGNPVDPEPPLAA